MILFGCRNRGFANGRVAEMEAGLGIVFLTVNTENKKAMECQVSCRGEALDSGNHPCSALRQGVGCKSIMGVACHRWFHERCSGISVRLRNNVDLYCRICSAQKVVLRKVEIEPGVKVKCVPTFCYLGDIYLVPVVVWRS